MLQSVKSLAANNGKAVNNQNIGVDGSSAGQAFQTAFVGVKSAQFGGLTFGRQVTLLSEGAIQYDPNYLSTAFGVLGYPAFCVLDADGTVQAVSYDPADLLKLYIYG